MLLQHESVARNLITCAYIIDELIPIIKFELIEEFEVVVYAKSKEGRSQINFSDARQSTCGLPHNGRLSRLEVLVTIPLGKLSLPGGLHWF